MKKYLHVILAVVLAVAAGLIVSMFISNNTPSVNVVVSTTRLSAGTVLQSNYVTTRMVAKSLLPGDAITDVNAVTGMVLNYPVLEGDVLREEHVTAGRGSLMARLMNTAPGKVAVDLPAETAQGLTGLSVGDEVNVYGEAVVMYNGEYGTSIEKVADRAQIIYAPGSTGNGAIIIACTPEEEKSLAYVLSSSKKVTLFLLQPDPADEGGATDAEEASGAGQAEGENQADANSE